MLIAPFNTILFLKRGIGSSCKYLFFIKATKGAKQSLSNFVEIILMHYSAYRIIVTGLTFQ